MKYLLENMFTFLLGTFTIAIAFSTSTKAQTDWRTSGSQRCAVIDCSKDTKSSSRPNQSTSSYDPEAEKRQRAHNANESGVAAFNRGDYETALNLFKQAAQLAPDNARIKQNLENAQAEYDYQQRQKKEAEEAAKRNKAAANAMQQSAQALANTLTVSADDGLDFEKSINLVKPPDLEFTKDPTSAAPCGGLTFGDTKTVDARCVPSGLGKFIDDSIAKEFAKSPAGVGERVSKGFQSLLVKDRSVALAWFKQALSLDPNNEGLKRVIDLIADTTKYQSSPKVLLPQPLFIDEKQANEDLMNTVLNNLAFFQPPSTPAANVLQVPHRDDIALLFMGKDAPTMYVEMGDGTFKTVQPEVGGTVFYYDGPYKVLPEGKQKPSTDPQDISDWEKYFKNNPSPLVHPPNAVIKP